MGNGMQPSRIWWGTSKIAIGEQRQWRIGPLHLRIEHRAPEWRIRHHSGDDPLEDTVRLAEPIPETGETAIETGTWKPDPDAQRFASARRRGGSNRGH